MRKVVKRYVGAWIVCLLVALPVAAASLTPPCRLAITSFDQAGEQVDSASLPGPRGAVDDPFRVAWEGTVAYEFDAGTVLSNNRSQVAVFGIPIMQASEAEPADSRDTGSISVGQGWPRFAGLVHVSGEISGEGGRCTADGWVQVVGEPVGSLGWLIGAGLIALGLVLVPLSLRRSVVAKVEQ